MSELGKRLADGDEGAFTEVVDQYSRKVYALCYRIVRDEEEARDLAQEVFVRVYTRRRSFGGRSEVYTWIYRIAVNTCLSALKRRRIPTVSIEDVEGALAAKPAAGADCPEDGEALEARVALVSKALEHLPPKQRSVFAMRFYDRRAFSEIAAAMGTSTGAAKANFHFAVERLRRLVGEVDRP
jgi:RNA polymerase sigma-70 factor (ECF subfamily)